MAKTLLITTTDIKQFTIVDGNVNNDKFIQFIEIAQDIHIQNILGTDLLEKLQADIAGSSLAGDYETLANKVKPALIYYAFYEYLHWAGVTIKNKGVFRHTAEAAVVVDPDEIQRLIDTAKNYADNYALRLREYVMEANSSVFPELDSNDNDDLDPDLDPEWTNWNLDGYTPSPYPRKFLDRKR